MSEETDTPQEEPDLEALKHEVADRYEAVLRYLKKWEHGLTLEEAKKVLRKNREHPITRAFVTVLRDWREQALEMATEEMPVTPQQPEPRALPESVLRERIGAVRALQQVEEGIMTIQMSEEEGE